jgi:hypothetical protein
VRELESTFGAAGTEMRGVFAQYAEQAWYPLESSPLVDVE